MPERENIVQYKNLVPTEKVTNPEDISPEILAKNLDTASNICKDMNFCAIAFNQISRETLDKIGFVNTNPSIIYFAKNIIINANLSGKLLINPELSLDNILGKSIDMEGCGSIIDKDGIRPNMFIERCSLVHGAGYLWDETFGKPEYREFVSASYSAGVLQHEDNHLLGKTALSDPQSIVNFTDYKSREEIIRSKFYYDRLYFFDTLDKFPHRLIYDGKEKRFSIISPKGNFLMYDFE